MILLLTVEEEELSLMRIDRLKKRAECVRLRVNTGFLVDPLQIS